MAVVTAPRHASTIERTVLEFLPKDPQSRRHRVRVIGVTGFFLLLWLLLWLGGGGGSKTNKNNVSSLLLANQQLTAKAEATAASVLQHHGKKMPRDYRPLNCQALTKRVEQEEPLSVSATFTNANTITDPNAGKVHSRQTDTPPQFTIALHNPKFDPPRWSIMKWGHYYETALIEAFSVVLNDTTTETTATTKRRRRRVLDVGGNIGYFALLSAAHGNIVVDSFEPNLKNSFRLCQSLTLNRWANEYQTQGGGESRTSVNSYPYGVGKEVGSLVFAESRNPGEGQIQDGNNEEQHPDEETAASNKHKQIIPVVSLDAFAESRGWLNAKDKDREDIALMKVDVEGYEINVMQGATRLLDSHLIRNIFMEVSARTPKEIEESRRTATIIASAGYQVHQYGGFRGPKHTVDWSSENDNVTALVDLILYEVTKKKHPQLNLWWSLGK